MTAGGIDAYLAGLSAPRRDRMAAILALVRARSGIIESMEWSMPTFRKGDRVFAVASRAGGLSLYFDARADLAARVAASLPGPRHGKSCVNVADGRALPLDALDGALADLFGDVDGERE